MAFMALKNNCLIKRNSLTSEFCSFYCLFCSFYCYLVSLITGPDKIGVKEKCLKGLVSQNLILKRIRYDLTGFDTGFSQKK